VFQYLQVCPSVNCPLDLSCSRIQETYWITCAWRSSCHLSWMTCLYPRLNLTSYNPFRQRFSAFLHFNILSRVYCSVTNNNGLWIRWLDLLTHSFTILIIAINYNNSQWLPKTRSIPYWTATVFSSNATVLVLVYESLTCEWITICGWRTMNESVLICTAAYVA
jgi:hypothetical protein